MEAPYGTLPDRVKNGTMVTAGFLGLGKLITVWSTVLPREVESGRACTGGADAWNTFSF